MAALKNHKAKHIFYKCYVLLAVLAGFLVSYWYYKSSRGKDETTAFLTMTGGIFSFVYFVQKQKLEELNLFKNLFTDFNQRYDKMNNDLNEIANAETKERLTVDQRKILDDYFNLCAEEFLFYQRGYIYPEGWSAWRNGMRYFLKKDDRIREYWLKEKESDSYYGLDILSD